MNVSEEHKEVEKCKEENRSVSEPIHRNPPLEPVMN